MGFEKTMYRITFRILETIDHFYESEQFGYDWSLNGFGLPDASLKRVYSRKRREDIGWGAGPTVNGCEKCDRSWFFSIRGDMRELRILAIAFTWPGRATSIPDFSSMLTSDLGGSMIGNHFMQWRDRSYQR